MAGDRGADAVVAHRRGAEDQRTAHAVADHASLGPLVGGGMAIQELDKGDGVAIGAFDGYGAQKPLDLGAAFGRGEVGLLDRLRGMADAIERVWRQHGVAGGGQTAAHVAEHRA